MKVTESVKIVVKTARGSRLCIEGKGCPAKGMLSAFYGLDPERRAWLLAEMQKAEPRLKAAEAASA